MSERYLVLLVFMGFMAVIAAVGFYFAAKERKASQQRR